MTTTFNGTTGVTYPDGSTQASAQVGMKNRLIDSGFIINQRTYVSGTVLAAGAYAHDRWKAGSGGGTYTFTQGSLGVPIGITITAGTIVQVIEGCNMGEGGAYTLSWTGTAQARINGGSYASSPITVTGLTAGANCTVEVGTGTFSYPQLEKGSTATSFDYRPYGTELALCQRYYELGGSFIQSGISAGNVIGTTAFYKTRKRATPTITLTAVTGSSHTVTTGVFTDQLNQFGYYGIPNGNGQVSCNWTSVAEL